MNTPVNSEVDKSRKTLTTVIYALYAASFFVGITAIVAIIMNYIKREEMAGNNAIRRRGNHREMPSTDSRLPPSAQYHSFFRLESQAMSNSRNLAKPKQPLSFFSKLFLAFAVVCSFAGDACAGRIAEKTGWNISAEEEKTVEKMPLPSGKLTDSMGTCQTATRISTSDEFKKEYQSRPVYFGHLWIWAQYHFGERARSKSDCRDQEFVIRAWQSALGLPITGVFGLKEAEAYLNYCPACDIRAQRENLKKLQFFGMNFGFKPEMPTCSEERGKYGYIESKGEFPCIENHVPLEGFRRDMSSATITTRVEFGNKRPGFLFSTLLVDLVDGQLEKMHFSLRRDYLEEIKAILRERLGKETVASNITEGVYRNHAESEFNFRREDIQATINCLSISSVCEVDVFSDRWINHQKKSVRSKIKEGVEF